MRPQHINLNTKWKHLGHLQNLPKQYKDKAYKPIFCQQHETNRCFAQLKSKE